MSYFQNSKQRSVGAGLDPREEQHSAPAALPWRATKRRPGHGREDSLAGRPLNVAYRELMPFSMARSGDPR